MVGPFLSVLAIVLGVTLLQGAHGILVVLLPLRMVAENLTALDVGWVATGYASGFLVGSIFSGRIIRAVGHIRAYAIYAAAMSIAVLAFAVTVDTWYWFGLRFITGICLAGLFTAADSWITDRAPASARGRVISLYLISTKIALALGPLVLTFAEATGAGPLMFIAALISMSLIPVAATRSPGPTMPDPQPMGVRKLFAIAPVAVAGAAAAGLTNTAVIGIVPAWGANAGLTDSAVAGLMAALQIGGLLGQWPLGWLSDSMDRRWVITGAALWSAFVAFLIAFQPIVLPMLPTWVTWLLVASWSAGAFAIYSICVAHAGDRAEPGQMVGITSALLLTWSAGSTLGPGAAALTMEWIGTPGLFVYAGTVAALISLYTLWRLRRRPGSAPADKEAFVALPAASRAMSELHPAAPEEPADQARSSDR